MNFEQFGWLCELKGGESNGVHVVRLSDRCLVFLESNMGYINGATIPLSVVNMLPPLYSIIEAFFQ